jgi:molecular chaperone DnaK (HSP70)
LKINRKKGVGKLKTLLAAQYDQKLMKEWKQEFGDRIVQHEKTKRNKVSEETELRVQFDDSNSTYRPVELTAHIFRALRNAAG